MLEEDESVVGEVVDRLVRALRPERIYLFGSRARGDWTEDSDYDILVVVPPSDETRHDQIVRAQRALGDLGISKDVLVETSATFARRAPVIASLAATVLREGQLLYGEPWLPEPGAQAVDVERERAGLTREWLVKASGDLKVAKLGMEADPPIPDLVVLHCQQAAEKALKGFLAWHNRPLRKTHDLEEIVAECEPIDADFAELRRAANLLAGYVIDPRYPSMMPEPTDECAQATHGAAEHIFGFVRARLPSTTHP